VLNGFEIIVNIIILTVHTFIECTDVINYIGWYLKALQLNISVHYRLHMVCLDKKFPCIDNILVEM